ncbi:MAG: HD family hydrolase [Candidatus Thorarchaeota archaeon]
MAHKLLSMITPDAISFFTKGEILKSLQRAGWATAGIECVAFESVADHSYGTALISLFLAKKLEEDGEDIDLGETLAMAILHDLGEAVVSDIPSTPDTIDSERFVAEKSTLEMRALQSILDPLGDLGGFLRNQWDTYRQGISLEARVVGSADTLDMLVHALSMERSGVSPDLLQGFFDSGRARLEGFGIALAMNLYRDLERQHVSSRGDGSR